MFKRRRKFRRILKKLPDKVGEIICARKPEDMRPIALMSQDEGRFGRISDCRYCWAPKGIRPSVPRQIVREYVYVYSAVCMEQGRMTSLILPYANTDMMSLFLEQVSEDFAGYFVIMLVDQAGWHMSAHLRVPENIRLIAQPSHSPELNPVEHIWEELREKALPNRAFKSLDELEDALCKGINDMDNDPERLKSMTNFPYLRAIS